MPIVAGPRIEPRGSDTHHPPGMSLITDATAYFDSLSLMTRAILTEIAKMLLRDLVLTPVRGWLGRTWRRSALPPLRRWCRRLGTALRSSVLSALRAMPPMLPMLPQAQRR